MPRFFTLPPQHIPYPFVLINAHNPMPGIRYIIMHRDVVEAVIIDSGVEIFRDARVKEYPGGPRAWIARITSIWRNVRKIVPDAEVYATIPDYPDDYNPRQFWDDEQRTNIEKTLDNVEYAITRYNDIDWIIPVQGHYEDPDSILVALEELEAIGALKWAKQHTKYVAIANVCVSKKCTTIERTVVNAKSWLSKRGYMNLRVHVFGPAVNCVSRIARLIDSWDSTAWTKPRAPGGSSAWSEEERAYLFITWIHKYASLIDLPPHPKSMRRRLKQQ